MKIFMFVNVDWFFFSHRLLIAKGAAQQGYDFTVYTDFTSDHLERAYGDFSIIQSPIARTSKTPLHLFHELVKTFLLIKTRQPDIVHSVTIKPIILLGLTCLILRIPFIASISGLGPAFVANGFFQRLRRWLIKLVYKIIFSPSTSRVICQSSHDSNILVKNKIVTSNKIVLTEGSGVDLSKYSIQNTKKSNSIDVLMASRLLPGKGVKEFCTAAGAINRSKNFNVRFFLAGPIDSQSPKALTLEQVTTLCKLNDVEYIGNRNDLNSVLAESDIFVLPSYYPEGVPKVLLEAAACGCAVITTNHPGCRDAIIPEETGLLVRSRDIISLKDGLTSLLCNRDLIKSMGKSGRRLAEKKFSVNNVIDIHYDLYHSFKMDKN